jgi:hypothetical protein
VTLLLLTLYPGFCSGSLAMVSSKEPLKTSVASHLKNLLMTDTQVRMLLQQNSSSAEVRIVIFT